MPDSSLPAQWIHGSESSKHNTDPDIQVHWYDDDTAILRQNKAIHYEAPFLYLLFGADRAVLLDTGATSSRALFPLRSVVDTLIGDWLQRRGIRDHHLLVLHTHSHDDHVAGDAQFLDRPDTTVVGADRDSAWRFLGFTEDDSESVRDLELGGRRVEVLATPGHDAAARSVRGAQPLLGARRHERNRARPLQRADGIQRRLCRACPAAAHVPRPRCEQ